MHSKRSGQGVAAPLNKQEVTRLTGASRRMLDHYEETGLIVPADPSPGRKRWSVDQAKLSERVRIMQHGSLGLDDISQIADNGGTDFLKTFQAQCSRDIREGWRQLKAAVIDTCRLEDALAIGRRSGLYLQWLPQRWYALMPLDDTDGRHLSVANLGRAFVELHSVAQVVGWCTTGGSGIIASLDDRTLEDDCTSGDDRTPGGGAAGGNRSAGDDARAVDGERTAGDGSGDARSLFAYIELATPPLPAPDADLPHDGGCYCDICEPSQRPPCWGDCASCSRYGRAPTTEERFRWTAAENANPGQWDHTLFACDMPSAYAYGVWSPAGRRGGPGALDALRPRLMPHEVPLPLGVTAASMPAGVYVCLQCDDGEELSCGQQLFGALLGVPHREFTEADELARVVARAGADGPPARSPDGPPGGPPDGSPPGAKKPPGGPGAPPRPPSPDPSHMFAKRLGKREVEAGWVRDVSVGDLGSLTLPTHMALGDADGFCMTCATLPTTERNAEPGLELHVLVDSGVLGPQADLGAVWPGK